MDYLLDRLTLPQTYRRKQIKVTGRQPKSFRSYFFIVQALKPLLMARDEVRSGKYSSCVELCSAPQDSAVGALFKAVDFTQ